MRVQFHDRTSFVVWLSSDDISMSVFADDAEDDRFDGSSNDDD